MFEALKGTGVYPKDRAVVCCCWDRQLGYWYVVDNRDDGGDGLAGHDPMTRARRIVSLLPEKLQARAVKANEVDTGYGAKKTYATLCSLVDPDGCGLHEVQALREAFEGPAPDAEATCRRLVELLNGAK